MHSTRRSARPDSWQANRDRLIAVFLLGLALFTPPVLVVFNRGDPIAGLPLLALYLFGAWAAFTTIVAVLVERWQRHSSPSGGRR